MSEFPASLIERCVIAINKNYTKPQVVFSCDIEAVLRESGHDELVAALKQARDDVATTGTSTDWRRDNLLAKIDEALRKAGAAP